MEAILRSCEGVKVRSEEKRNWQGRNHTVYTFYKTSDIVVPKNVYIEITCTATIGTIARIVDVEVETHAERYKNSKNDEPNKLVTYGGTIIYEVDGRKQKGRINEAYAKVLLGEHKTNYVRNVKKHDKAEIKNPVNKYKQELQRGDWVIGVKPGKSLGIGRISRWTNSNVWAVTPGAELDDKSREFKFDSINETFTIPPDDIEQSLTMAVLKGYKGG